MRPPGEAKDLGVARAHPTELFVPRYPTAVFEHVASLDPGSCMRDV